MVKMNTIRMIVTDLDDTLLRSDKSISPYSRDVLARCRAAGIKVVYATARGGSASRLAPEELFDGRIVMNGAVAHIGDQLVYDRLIPYAAARPVLLAMDALGLRAASELSGMHYSNFAVSEIWPELTYYEVVDFNTHERNAEKLYAILDRPEDAERIQALLPDMLYMSVSSDGLAMIMHKDATKAKAIAKLAEIWGIGAESIAAFGDGLNDIDMLHYAGVSVAMENALGAVKRAADQLCPGCDSDGVAKWIEMHISL